MGKAPYDKKKILLLVAAVAVLFYISPFSEVNHEKCLFFDTGVPNSGAICGIPLYGESHSIIIFPFREKSNEGTAFCKRNIESVNTACNIKVVDLLYAEFSGNGLESVSCEYVLDDAGKEVYLTIEKKKRIGETLVYFETPGNVGSFNLFDGSKIEIYSTRFDNAEECPALEKLLG